MRYVIPIQIDAKTARRLLDDAVPATASATRSALAARLAALVDSATSSAPAAPNKTDAVDAEEKPAPKKRTTKSKKQTDAADRGET